jgi:amino acid adenylation domain-containing protein
MAVSVVELFEAQADRNPDRIAVKCGLDHLTFGELNDRSNRLARTLLGSGVNQGDIVAVCLDRSPSYVVVILAVLKAGCAFLPLDPRYPLARLDFMIRDSGTPALVTESQFVSRFHSLPPHTVLLDEESKTVGCESPENPRIAVRLDSPAYAVYTSGSTGKPKGALCPQAGLLNRLTWMWEQFPYQPDEISCQIIALSFVDSIYEIFCPLLHGVEIIILPNEVVRGSPVELMRALERHAITRIITVPSVLSYWLPAIASLNPVAVPLKYCFVSGEVLLGSLAGRFRETLPNARLINFYGASELSHHATWFEVTGSLDKSVEKSVPIGRPIANTQTYVLDSEMQPVPLGTPGELYMGGSGLARGYLNLPELTALRFVENPFEAGSRLFKTGDLCRALPHGNLQYLGRMDQQVKIRGCRIEPAEVEAALKTHTGVREAIVGGRENERGEQQLVAWVVPHQAGFVTSTQLRRFLEQSLPDYSVPSQFVFLSALPRLPNNKVNRRELPEPGRFLWDRKALGGMPREGLEQSLAAIWEQLLDARPLGLEDDFFELGGHSLLAARMIDMIADQLGSAVPMAPFMESPTIAQLVRLVEGETFSAYPRYIVPVQPLGSRVPFFCFGAGVAFRMIARRLGLDQPFFGVSPDYRDLQWVTKGTPLTEIVRRMLESVRAFQPSGPYFLGGHSMYGLFAYEAACQLQAEGREVAVIIMLDTFLPAVARDRCSIWTRLGAYTSALWERASERDFGATSRHIANLVPRGWSFARRMLKKSRGASSSELMQEGGDTEPEELSALLAAAERAYIPRPYGGRITLLEATSQLLGRAAGARFGWKDLCEGALDIRTVPGDHNSILTPPYLDSLVGEISGCLESHGPSIVNVEEVNA